MPSRRAALRLGGLAATATLAGCSRLPFVTGPKLTLTALNFTDEPRRVTVDLLRAAGTERSESLVYSEAFDLAANGPGDVDRRQDEGAVESRKYLVRAAYEGGPRYEYTFYPDCTGDGQPRDELYVGVTSREAGPPYLDFQQNICSRDASAY